MNNYFLEVTTNWIGQVTAVGTTYWMESMVHYMKSFLTDAAECRKCTMHFSSPSLIYQSISGSLMPHLTWLVMNNFHEHPVWRSTGYAGTQTLHPEIHTQHKITLYWHLLLYHSWNMAVLLTWTKSSMPILAPVCLSGDQTALHLGQYVHPLGRINSKRSWGCVELS